MPSNTLSCTPAGRFTEIEHLPPRGRGGQKSSQAPKQNPHELARFYITNTTIEWSLLALKKPQTGAPNKRLHKQTRNQTDRQTVRLNIQAARQADQADRLTDPSLQVNVPGIL